MDQLIPIQNKNGKETVNARDLHKFLEVQTQYKDWIRSRIEKYGFIEGVDFVAVAEKKATAQGNESTYITHYLSIDMAKELSMVENNAKGREARQYFIEVENKAREMFTGPMLLAKAVLEANAMLEQKDKLILEMKPKAEFYDAVTGSKKAVHLGDVAKNLDFIGMGRNNLFQFLREKKILMSNNQPYQEFVDRGFFRVVQTSYTNARTGSIEISYTTHVYQKGVEFIRKALLASGIKERGVS